MSPSSLNYVEKRIRPVVNPKDWIDPEPGDDRYGPDQMVGAFRAGVATGVERVFEASQHWMQHMREQNAAKAAAHTGVVLDFLRSKGLHPKSAILDPRRFDVPRVMILLPLEEYAGEGFKGVFSFVAERETAWREKDYEIQFMFAHGGDTLNHDLLRADGFTLHYTPLMA